MKLGLGMPRGAEAGLSRNNEYGLMKGGILCHNLLTHLE